MTDRLTAGRNGRPTVPGPRSVGRAQSPTETRLQFPCASIWSPPAQNTSSASPRPSSSTTSVSGSTLGARASTGSHDEAGSASGSGFTAPLPPTMYERAGACIVRASRQAARGSAGTAPITTTSPSRNPRAMTTAISSATLAPFVPDVIAPSPPPPLARAVPRRDGLEVSGLGHVEDRAGHVLLERVRIPRRPQVLPDL